MNIQIVLVQLELKLIQIRYIQGRYIQLCVKSDTWYKLKYINLYVKQFQHSNCISWTWTKTNTKLLHIRLIHSISRKIGHVVQIVVHQFVHSCEGIYQIPMLYPRKLRPEKITTGKKRYRPITLKFKKILIGYFSLTETIRSNLSVTGVVQAWVGHWITSLTLP